MKTQTKEPTLEWLQLIIVRLEFCNSESYLVTSATKVKSLNCKAPQQRQNLESTVLAPNHKTQDCNKPKDVPCKPTLLYKSPSKCRQTSTKNPVFCTICTLPSRPSSNPPSEQIKMCWEQEAPGETPGAPGSHVAAKTFGLKSCGDGKKL